MEFRDRYKLLKIWLKNLKTPILYLRDGISKVINWSQNEYSNIDKGKCEW